MLPLVLLKVVLLPVTLKVLPLVMLIDPCYAATRAACCDAAHAAARAAHNAAALAT